MGSCWTGIQQKTKYMAFLAVFVQCLLIVFGAIMIVMTHGGRDSGKHRIEKLIWGSVTNTADLKKDPVWDLIEDYERMQISEIFWTWFTLISAVTLADYVLLICAAQCKSLTMCNTWCSLTGMICLLDLAPLIYILSADYTAKLTFLVVTVTGYVFRIILYIIVTLLVREIIREKDLASSLPTNDMDLPQESRVPVY